MSTLSTTRDGDPEGGSSAQHERRQRILDGTIALASQGGYDAVQMRAVAEEADVALGTLYRYFPSKVHLLVSALGREFRRAELASRGRAVPGDDPADRVIAVLKRISRGLQGDRHLTEALTRAFMFADASVKEEIEDVGMSLTAMLTQAMHPVRTDSAGRSEPSEPSAEDVMIARVIGDVWLSSLTAWVTGRASAAETAQHIERAVRLVLR